MLANSYTCSPSGAAEFAELERRITDATVVSVMCEGNENRLSDCRLSSEDSATSSCSLLLLQCESDDSNPTPNDEHPEESENSGERTPSGDIEDEESGAGKPDNDDDDDNNDGKTGNEDENPTNEDSDGESINDNSVLRNMVSPIGIAVMVVAVAAVLAVILGIVLVIVIWLRSKTANMKSMNIDENPSPQPAPEGKKRENRVADIFNPMYDSRVKPPVPPDEESLEHYLMNPLYTAVPENSVGVEGIYSEPSVNVVNVVNAQNGMDHNYDYVSIS